MSSIFTRIINGEIPGRIVWRDMVCVAMVDIRPLNRGHVLVIPIEEVDRWTDLSADTASHCMTVARTIGRAQQELFAPLRVGLMIAGFEVPHAHLHVVPSINDEINLSPKSPDEVSNLLTIAAGTPLLSKRFPADNTFNPVAVAEIPNEFSPECCAV